MRQKPLKGAAIYVSPDRPTEELVGQNRMIVRQILGRIHCCSSLLEAARAARPKRGCMRTYPVELRRGWVKCVIDTMAEYRGTYVAVMGGRL